MGGAAVGSKRCHPNGGAGPVAVWVEFSKRTNLGFLRYPVFLTHCQMRRGVVVG